MKKTWIIIGGIILCLALIIGGIFLVVSLKTDRIVCKSSLGNIIILYNNDKLITFRSTGSISYDFDNQQPYAKKIGVENYINEFDEWFVENTDGSCKIK